RHLPMPCSGVWRVPPPFPTRRSSDLDKSTRPTAPQAGPLPQPEDGLAPRPLRAQTPAPSPPPEARVISSANAEDTMPTPKARQEDRKSTRLNSSHVKSSYAVFCLKKK